jgi:Probable cobalt transporter subunit (CbtA)
MERRLILRGFGAGALGGVLAFVFARLIAEPVIQRAIDYENGRAAAAGALRRAAGLAAAAPDPELFSRSVQRNLGLGVEVIVFGVAIGGLFAVAYVLVARDMRPRVQPRTLALLIAAAGFVGVFLAPFVKYPANPPGIGHAASIHARGLLYLAMVAISIASVTAAALVARRLTVRLGRWNAAVLAAGGLVAVLAIVIVLLPSFAETPHPLRDRSGAIVFAGFPADVLYQFRLYAVAGQLVLWGTIGVAFGTLAERLLARPARVGARLIAGERSSDVFTY